MIIKLTPWKIAATALAATVCLGGCQTVGSWFPPHDKVAEARANAAAPDTMSIGPITPEQKINVQLAVARSFEEENQADQAMKIYLDVIKKDSGCIVAYHHLGLLYSKKGEWELSQKYFDVAIKKAPKNIDLLCDVGYSYYLQHRDQEAEVCLRRAIALDTDNGLAHNNLGLLLARLGRQDDALKEFSLAGCNQAQAHANLALAYSMENRLPEARAQYHLALAADPNLAIAKSGLAALEAVDRHRPPVATERPANNIEQAQFVAPSAYTQQVPPPATVNNIEQPQLVSPGIAGSF